MPRIKTWIAGTAILMVALSGNAGAQDAQQQGSAPPYPPPSYPPQPGYPPSPPPYPAQTYQPSPPYPPPGYPPPSYGAPPPRYYVRRGVHDHDGFFLRLAVGPSYMHESYNYNDGTPSGSAAGWGPSFELSIGGAIVPGLIIGGMLQFTSVSEPNFSYNGMTTPVTGVSYDTDLVAAFIDYYPNPHLGFHVGGALGLAGASSSDLLTGDTETSTYWGLAIAPHIGYEVYFADQWSVGFLFRLAFYRYSVNNQQPSFDANGVMPSFLLAFTFN